MNACKSGSKKVVAEMMKRGAFEVLDERQTRPKLTAAHEAAKSGALECLQVSLTLASSIHNTKPFKQVASFLLQVLSGYGAKFDSYDEFGNNPIHYAAMDGRAMCIKFLAQRGSSSPSFMKRVSCAWLVM